MQVAGTEARGGPLNHCAPRPCADSLPAHGPVTLCCMWLARHCQRPKLFTFSMWSLVVKQAAYLRCLPAICEREVVFVPVAAHGQRLQPPCQLHRLQPRTRPSPAAADRMAHKAAAQHSSAQQATSCCSSGVRQARHAQGCTP